jgi:hypothetical protein
MRLNKEWTIKGIAMAVTGTILVLAGIAFAQHRNFKEEVVLGPGVTTVRTLGDYFAPLKGGPNDANVFILDSGEPGGTMLVLGASHPEEPATSLTAHLLVENATVEQGKLIVVIHSNPSASTVTRPGDAYPRFFHIETDWGIKKFRMGDRWANPLDSWPDPETYVHFPSGQLLAYMDVRNLNRTWPGRSNGSLAEQTCYAFMRLIEAEGVDIVIDLHEAELEYPIIGTIVAHQKALRIAAMASMTLTAEEFRIGMEISPLALHGLSHREIGDHSNAPALLAETPQPFLDRVRGITDESLLLTGKDEFVMKAGEFGLLYWPIDESGWPIDARVGRHCSTVLKIAEFWTLFNRSKPLVVTSVPRYADVVANGTGYFFQDPATASASKVVYE